MAILYLSFAAVIRIFLRIRENFDNDVGGTEVTKRTSPVTIHTGVQASAGGTIQWICITYGRAFTVNFVISLGF